jgi:prepilin-type N-terminal cleavage/methylation domain-containing protein
MSLTILFYGMESTAHNAEINEKETIPMNKKNNRKGFTTVELVIVIAVIAILAAVLIPTFSNLISKANESAALQEATSTFKNYMIDKAETYTGGEVYIVVNEDYTFKAVNGKIVNKPVSKADAEALDCGDIQIRTAKDSDDADAKLAGYVDFTPAHTDTTPKDGTCDKCGKTGLPTT